MMLMMIMTLLLLIVESSAHCKHYAQNFAQRIPLNPHKNSSLIDQELEAEGGLGCSMLLKPELIVGCV